MIGTGSMTDPYIPLEAKLCNVQKSLQLIERYGFGFTVITKSDLILRDLDLLKSINQKDKVRCANDFDNVQRRFVQKDWAECKYDKGAFWSIEKDKERRDTDSCMADANFAVY